MDDETNITEDLLTPWSISKAKTARQCTQRFHWYYLQDVKRDGIAHPAGRVGGAVHYAIEKMLLDGDRSFKDAIKDGAIGEGLSYEETLTARAYKKDVEHFIEKFRDWKTDAVDVEETFIEKKAAVTKDLDPIDDWWDSESIYFRSIWDIGALIHHKNKRTMVIFDHKTGRPRDISNYEKQLRSYTVTAYAHFPDIDGVQTALHWLKKPQGDSFDWSDYYSRSQIEDEIIPWFYEYFEHTKDLVKQEPRPTEGFYCDFCPFQYKCPKKD